MPAQTWLLLGSKRGWCAAAICQGAVDIWLPELLSIWEWEDCWLHRGKGLQVGPAWLRQKARNQTCKPLSPATLSLVLQNAIVLSQLALKVHMEQRPRKERRKLSPWQRVGLLGNKPETFRLKEEAVVKAMPALHEKGPFPPRSFPAPPLAEAGPEDSWASKAAWTGPWLRS